MELDLSGKTALVTGGSIGIGPTIAALLAEEGCRVAILARREELLNAVADKIAAAGPERPLVSTLLRPPTRPALNLPAGPLKTVVRGADLALRLESYAALLRETGRTERADSVEERAEAIWAKHGIESQ